MLRALTAVLLCLAACGRPPSAAPPVAKTPAPPPDEPPVRTFNDPNPRKVVVEGPVRRGPYVQAVGRTEATVCFELTEAGEGNVTCEGKTLTSPRGLRHEIVIGGLKPATRYGYTIQPGGATGSFKTAPDENSDQFFIVWGDSRTYHDRLARVAGLAAKDLPDFTVHSGDLVDEGTIEEDWDKFFAASAPLLQTGGFWPAIGNHDYGAKQYFDLFVLPAPESYYSFTSGSAQFFILDSNWQPRKNPKQIEWFAQEAKKSKARFKFLVCHHPLVSSPADDFLFDKEWSMYGLFGKSLEEAGFAAVFQGHNHNYQRAERNGVVYITTGGAGAPLYDVGTLSPETKFAREVHHYVRVRLAGRTMSIEAVDWDGQVIDRDEKTVK